MIGQHIELAVQKKRGQHVELASKKKREEANTLSWPVKKIMIGQHFELATSKNIYEKRTVDVQPST